MSVDVSADAAETFRIWIGWNKFSQPITFHAVFEFKQGGVQLCKSLYVKNVNLRVRCKSNEKDLVQNVNNLKIKYNMLSLAVHGED